MIDPSSNRLNTNNKSTTYDNEDVTIILRARELEEARDVGVQHFVIVRLAVQAQERPIELHLVLATGAEKVRCA